MATTEALDGKNVQWLEHVTDEQYNVGPAAGGEPPTAMSITAH